MDFRLKDEIKGWLRDIGALYILVSLFVGICFLLRATSGPVSCNPSAGKSARGTPPPGYYGRNP